MTRLSFIIVALLLASNVQAGEIIRLKSTGAIKANSFSTSSQDTGLYIVQWKGSVLESEKRIVESAGLKILSYVPDDAFLAQGDLSNATQVMKLAFVNSVVPFEPGMKIEPELTRNGVFGFTDSVLVSVQITADANEPAVRELFSASKNTGAGVIVGETTVGNLWTIVSRKDVIWAERFLPVKSMDLSYSDLVADGSSLSAMATTTGFESGTKVMNVESAYSAGVNGAGQIIAVADTGLDSGDLNNLILDFQGQVKGAFAMGLGGSSWGDPLNHGTHVSGSILGNGKSSNGLIRGAAYGAQLVMEGLYSDILQNISIPGIPKLFDKANSEGARIHSNSWGAPSSNGRYDNFAVQADTWLFNNLDFLAVFAAGNDGSDLSKDGVIDEGTVSTPGTSKNVLTVGASKNYLLEGGIQRKLIDLRAGKDKWGVEPLASSMLSEDSRGMACFSSRGPTADGRIKPEIVAPGTNIVSARSKNPKAKPEESWGIYDDNYLYMGGTSMATPLTSGAMGLIRQNLLARLKVNSVSSALLKATVANTAEDLYPGQFGARSTGQEQPTRRPNNHEGWGRVNLETLFSDQGLAFFDERAGLATGQEKVMQLSVRDISRPIRITMAYTDAPGTAAAAKTLVNDLDLVLVDPAGTVLYPNHLSSKDNTNNMEQIDVLNPVVGVYQVKVKGASIPQGKNGSQPYALVVSAGF